MLNASIILKHYRHQIVIFAAKKNSARLNQLLTYRTLQKGIVFLLLIGQLWTNVGLYCNWFHDTQSELVELCNAEDC